ncbi:MAG: glycosyltransferase [Gammaproteobacteria bacterium]|nr:glycosyltransferase [Gammaproteobacteria bacterium]
MSQTRTVVFVIEALTVGGAEQMLVAMANEFSHRGWLVHLVCLTAAGELAENLDDAVDLHVLNKQPGFDRRLPGKLRALIKRIQPQAVNAHLWTANLWTRLSLIGTGIPVVVTEHSRDTWKPSHYRLLDRQLARFTHKLVAVSRDTANFYTDTIGISPSLVTVINNGIDAERYATGNGMDFRKQWAPNNEFLIGTVGRMVSAKNHPRLVDVALLLKDKIDDFKILIVGDGPERDVVNQYITECNAEALVHLIGARSDIPDVLSGLDLFVLSSDREGHPLTALEAQAAGTPVVLTNAGGSADAIGIDADQCGGLLVDKDAVALAAAITTLANDAQRLNAMSEFAANYAHKHFDKSAMVDSYEQLFD